MNDLTPHQPERPLFWPDILFDLQELLSDVSADIYVVGGAVRDAYLHRPLKDIDLATSGDAMRLARKIANHYNGDFFPLDADRDVGRALIDTPEGRLVFDVAHFRGADLLADLKDRDFTLNAMAVDVRGDLSLIIDPLDGEHDIKSKQIRRCSPDSLVQDSIRALRAVRQSVQLGMRIEPQTVADVRRAAPELAFVSPERVRDEFFKLLALPRPAAACRVADVLGVLEPIIPETKLLHTLHLSVNSTDAWTQTLLVIENLANLFAVIEHTRADSTTASFTMGLMAIQLDRYRSRLQEHIASLWPNERSHRALLVLAALLHATGTVQGEIESSAADIASGRASSLRLSNAERERLVAIVQYYHLPLDVDVSSPLAIHRFWRQVGESGIDDCLLSMVVYLGMQGAQIEQDAWLKVVDRIGILLEAYFERYDTLIVPPLLVDGNQLMQTFTLRPGPLVGQLLDRIREAQVSGMINSADEAIQFAREYLEQQS